VLRAMSARRSWREAGGHGVLRLIAPRDSRRAFEVRDLLERNLMPVRWYDADADPESARMLEWLRVPREETPVLVRNDTVLRNPSAAQVARELGLRTLVTEAWVPGGQAGSSTRIENYLGFPTGISGAELTRKATLQARRFDAVLSSFHRAVELARGPEGLVRVDLDDGQHVLARTVVVATGARWRTLDAQDVDRFTGAGVYHAAMNTDAERYRDEDVIVVGAATRPARPRCTSPGRRAASGSSSAARGSRPPCRATCSTASSRGGGSRCSPARR